MKYLNITPDICGNPRIIIHYCDIFPYDLASGKDIHERIRNTYNIAHAITKQVGGKKYKSKKWVGYFVFQSYVPERTIQRLKIELNKLNHGNIS